MAYKYMSAYFGVRTGLGGEGNSYFYEDAAGDWVIIPAGAKAVTVELDATGAGIASKVQMSNDKAGVLAGTAVGVDWPHDDHGTAGVITNTTDSSSVTPCFAVRQVKSGTDGAKLRVYATI